MISRAGYLNKAAGKRNDEFFTAPDSVVRELTHHREHLDGKRILCNCRDIGSAFEAFFATNRIVRVSKLVVVGKDSYKTFSDFDEQRLLWQVEEKAYQFAPTPASYDDAICQKLLAECDVVVTNPPFSKIRHFVKTIIDAGKDFLIIAPITAIGNKYIGNLVVEGKVRVGYTQVKEPFLLPDGTEQKFGNCVWLTTLPVKHTAPVLAKESSSDRLFYDTLPEVMFVERVKDIPADYDGIMAVPLTYLCYHNDDGEFELVDGRTLHKSEYAILSGYEVKINGEQKFTRVLIRRKK